MSLSIHFYAIHSICSWTNIRKSNTHTSNTIINSFFLLIRSLSSAFAHFLPHLFFFKSSAYAQYPLHINKNMHALECNRVIYQCVQNWAWALFDKEKKLQFSFSLIFSLALSHAFDIVHSDCLFIIRTAMWNSFSRRKNVFYLNRFFNINHPSFYKICLFFCLVTTIRLHISLPINLIREEFQGRKIRNDSVCVIIWWFFVSLFPSLALFFYLLFSPWKEKKT